MTQSSTNQSVRITFITWVIVLRKNIRWGWAGYHELSKLRYELPASAPFPGDQQWVCPKKRAKSIYDMSLNKQQQQANSSVWDKHRTQTGLSSTRSWLRLSVVQRSSWKGRGKLGEGGEGVGGRFWGVTCFYGERRVEQKTATWENQANFIVTKPKSCGSPPPFRTGVRRGKGTQKHPCNNICATSM